MTSINLATAIAIAAVFVSGAAIARSAHAKSGDHDRAKPVLQVVSNISVPGDASYGWQYFSDPRAKRAVIISPAGEYFLSRGAGPRQITGPEAQVSTTKLAKE